MSGRTVIALLMAAGGYCVGLLWAIDVGAAIGCAIALAVVGTMAWRVA